jgi:hypothetical protein
MEGSGLEFNCCIVNLENTKKKNISGPPVHRDSIAVFPPLSE